MSVITVGDFAKALEPLSGKWFGDGYKRHPELFKEIMEVRRSDRAYEEDALISGIGLMQATPSGEPTPYDKMKQGYVKRYTHADYRLGLIITQNMIDDGINLNLVRRQAEALGRSAIETKNTIAFNVLNRAFNSSYVGGDGKELCATDHPTVAGNMRNELSTASDLNEAALEQMDVDLGDIKDDRGLRINLKPKKFVIPRALKFEAHRIFKSVNQPGNANNDVNAIRDMSLFPEGVIAVDYLTDSDAFFMLTDCMDGLVYYSRKEPVLSNDKDFDTDNAKFKAHMRCAVGWTDWRHVFGSPGA